MGARALLHKTCGFCAPRGIKKVCFNMQHHTLINMMLARLRLCRWSLNYNTVIAQVTLYGFRMIVTQHRCYLDSLVWKLGPNKFLGSLPLGFALPELGVYVINFQSQILIVLKACKIIIIYYCLTILQSAETHCKIVFIANFSSCAWLILGSLHCCVACSAQRWVWLTC